MNGDQWVAGTQHKAIDLWSPVTRTWTRGPAQVENRSYHSTALLLPDGRVLSAGDDVNGGHRSRHGGDLLAALPVQGRAGRRSPRRRSSIGWGSRFAVGTPSADVTKAVLVAPSAVTHAVDMNQRLVTLGG